MPSLKELRSQLKKSMKPISKMSRDEVVLMLEKHKVEPVVEKKKLVKEHEELVQVLEKPTKKAVEKEVKKQSSELKELKKPTKKVAIKLPESSSEDEMPKEKVMKKKAEESVEKVKGKKKVTDQEDKSSSSETKDLTTRQRWGQLRKEGLSSAEAWAKVRS